MKATFEAAPIRASRLTANLAAFSFTLLLATGLLHRAGVMGTPIALSLFGAAFAFSVAALLTGVVATFVIWRKGSLGFASTLVGMITACGILAWPLSYLPTYLALPMLNDISTDYKTPPRFAVLAELRDRGANSVAYPGERAAILQAAAYADVQPFIVDRSAEDAFELAKDVLRRDHRMKIVAEEPPGGKYGATGIIEAIDRTLIMGFSDDVVVRVIGDQRQARIDVRSASRYGRHDFGRNAARTRRLLKDFQARLEIMLPGGGGMAQRRAQIRAAAAKALVPKRQKDGEKRTGAQKTTQDRGGVQTPREPAPKVVPKESRPRPPKGGFE